MQEKHVLLMMFVLFTSVIQSAPELLALTTHKLNSPPGKIYWDTGRTNAEEPWRGKERGKYRQCDFIHKQQLIKIHGVEAANQLWEKKKRQSRGEEGQKYYCMWLDADSFRIISHKKVKINARKRESYITNKVKGQTYLYLVSSGEYLALALNIT